jgi:hypothetical protein
MTYANEKIAGTTLEFPPPELFETLRKNLLEVVSTKPPTPGAVLAARKLYTSQALMDALGLRTGGAETVQSAPTHHITIAVLMPDC